GSHLPHLAIDPDRRPVLSWVEPRGAGAALVYSVLEGDRWSAPVTVAEGEHWFLNWADFPAVHPLDGALWAAHWLVKQPGGMYAYDIAVAVSRDGGRHWEAPFRPHDDDTPTEHGFVSLWPAVLADGATAIGVAWLDGRHNLLDPSAAEPDDPRTMLMSGVFHADGRLVRGAPVDERVCDCCQTAVALTDDGPLVAYRDRSPEEVRDIHLAAGGRQGWRPLGPVAEEGWIINGCPVNGPGLSALGPDRAVAWYTEAGGERRVRIAFASGERWEPAITVAGGNVLGRVAVTLLPDGAAAVSWLGNVTADAAKLSLARVERRGAVSEPLEVATVPAGRPSGFPQLLRDGDRLLLAWTAWNHGQSRVTMARVPLAALTGD
ncbi:MAG TPA: sialidase family protein, partial [Pseudomonadales bacterium]